MFEKVTKTMVFAEGTDLQRLLDNLALMDIFDGDLHGFTQAIYDSRTGEKVMDAPSIKGTTYTVLWNALKDVFGLETVDNPDYKDYLFSFGK